MARTGRSRSTGQRWNGTLLAHVGESEVPLQGFQYGSCELGFRCGESMHRMLTNVGVSVFRKLLPCRVPYMPRHMMPVFKIVYIPDRIRYGLCWLPDSAEIGVYRYPRLGGGREEDLAMYPYQNNPMVHVLVSTRKRQVPEFTSQIVVSCTLSLYIYIYMPRT